MSLEELMGITVTASKRAEPVYNAPGIVTVYTKEEIKRFGARTLFDVLNQLPRVYCTGSYLFPNNVPSVRGDLPTHTNNHTLILINGRPVRESNSGGWNFPVYMAYPVDMIERIELVRGPCSPLYGSNAYTGVINVITKTGTEDTKWEFFGQTGSHNYRRTNVTQTGTAGKIKMANVFQYTGADGWDFAMVDETGTWKSTDVDNKSFSFASHMRWKDVTTDLYCAREEAMHVGVMPRWALPTNNHEIVSNRVFFNLGIEHEFSENVRLDSHFTYNYSDIYWQQRVTNHKSEDFLGEFTLHVKPTNKMNLIGGFVYEVLTAPKLPNSPVPKYNEKPLGAYAQADYLVTDNLKLIGGIQWNKPDGGKSDVVTRAGVVYHFNKNWGIKLLRGEAFRAPWLSETVIQHPVLIGNSSLQPETIITYDAQVFYHNKDIEASLTYFCSTLKDLITRVSTGGTPTYDNGGSQKFNGIEFEGKKYFNDNLHLLGSVTYQDSKQTNDLVPSLAPLIMGKVGLGYDRSKLKMGLFYTYFSNPPKIASASQVNPDPDAVNWITANLDYDITEYLSLKKAKCEVTLSIENLLDEEVDHPEFSRRNINSTPFARGMSIYGGVRILF
jgi:outer membrane receptor for ferrienterochelin and colicins